MEFSQRLEVLTRLQAYMLSDDAEWQAAKEKAFIHNAWFIPDFINLAAENIANILLDRPKLQEWAGTYDLVRERQPADVGVIMAGNIPLAGFYHFLCIFLAGHKQRIRLSPKDEVLLRHLIGKMVTWDAAVAPYISFGEMLKGCDAYVAAVDSNTSQQFERYFNKYPNLIYRATSAAAVLQGDESRALLELLADDVFQYFGRGCMNVTRLYVPRQYDFIPLIKAFDKYRFLIDHNKYKNNYDYQLSLLILNKEFYMTNGCILLTENAAATTPVARLHYSYYDNVADVTEMAIRGGVKQLVGGDDKPVGRAGYSVACDIKSNKVLQFLRDL